MHIGIPQETRADETRCRDPETVKKYVALGHQVTVQSGAGVAAAQPDDAYVAAGAKIGTAAGSARRADRAEGALARSGRTGADAAGRGACRHAQSL